MHTLPSEIGDRIGTSTLFAAWNAAIYVNQIEDERLEPVVTAGAYLNATQQVLQTHGGLWFNDETFVVSRRRALMVGMRFGLDGTGPFQARALSDSPGTLARSAEIPAAHLLEHAEALANQFALGNPPRMT